MHRHTAGPAYRPSVAPPRRTAGVTPPYCCSHPALPAPRTGSVGLHYLLSYRPSIFLTFFFAKNAPPYCRPGVPPQRRSTAPHRWRHSTILLQSPCTTCPPYRQHRPALPAVVLPQRRSTAPHRRRQSAVPPTSPCHIGQAQIIHIT